MSQNPINSLVISVALLAFIISSGTYLVYQIAKDKMSPEGNSQNSLVSNLIPNFDSSNVSSSSIATEALFYSSSSSVSSSSKSLIINITADKYKCGNVLSGSIDNVEAINNLTIKLTNKSDATKTKEFQPSINSINLFKLEINSNELPDGLYEGQYNITSTEMITRSASFEIDIKSKCENATESNISSQTTLINNSKSTDLPINSEIQKIDEFNSIRSGGGDYKIEIIVLIMVSYLIHSTYNKNKKINLKSIFGSK